ncbi:MAG: AAA family ATPase [Actinomycetota bacterium]
MGSDEERDEERTERRVPLFEELARMGLMGDRSAPDATDATDTAPRRQPAARPPADTPSAASPAEQEPPPRSAAASPPPASPPAPPPADPLYAPPGPTAESLTAETVLKPQRQKPSHGWRRAVYVLTGGVVNPGPSAGEIHRQALEGRARTVIKGCHRAAVISLKGGVGKTTTTAVLGATFSSARGDRVIAVDANPDRGTLAEKVGRETHATVRDLLAARPSVERYADIREFTSQARNRLEVLASDSDPSVSLAFSEQEYRDVLDLLERYYSLILTDCGTGLLHSAMQGALGLADSIVVVSSPSLDGARSASATLDWLEAHGFGDLVRRAVVVISIVRSGSGDVDLGKLEEHFAARCRAVQQIPYDPHLATGAAVDLDELKPATRHSFLQLAALVGDGFQVSQVTRA